jgi:hypothetical protein
VIRGIFDGYGIAAFEQHTHYEIERLLGAVHDDHVRGVADHGTRAAEMGADSFAQRGAAGGGTVIEMRDGGFACTPQQDAPPHLEGKGLNVALAAAEGEIVTMHAGTSALKIQCSSGPRRGGAKAREA